MAVPKKKRYREVVRTRRSLQQQSKILTKNLSITKFNSYASILTIPNSSTKFYCDICHNNDQINEKKLCASCYVIYFFYSFNKQRIGQNIGKKKKRYWSRYYYELSKTLISPSRP